ncbi:MAG TPA: gamma-glutamyltransferase [Longimicrobiales bacterium]|nr:gamma-glutamyltransferase [Longimicrobiales bacterium]
MPPFTGRPATRSTRAMISTPHYLATEAGVQALRREGSAVDACIAAHAVLCVAYPHMTGLGGDGFWLVRDPATRAIDALNASGPAAALATADRYRGAGLDAPPGRGPAAALTVPGAVDGWRLAHERYGALPWAELFEDAIRLAREGVPVARGLAAWIRKDRAPLADEDAGGVFLPAGVPLLEGDRLVIPGLAATLERIARLGARPGFYEGETAHEACRSLGERGSPLRAADFAGYVAEWTSPISVSYRDFQVVEFPPNTQGLAALEILAMLDSFDVAAWGDPGVDYLHHVVEATKLAFADRDAWVADPRRVDIPLERLLSAEYAAERRALIDPEGVMDRSRVRPGLPFDVNSFRPRSAGGDTCYLCAVDGDGLVASTIQSIFHDFGSMAIGGATGVLLQNRGSAFSLREDDANRLEPGKRPFHTLTPALLLRDGEAYAAFGAMGGDGQPQTHAALVTRLLDFGYDVQQAIEAPRWRLGRSWGAGTDALALEGRIPDEVGLALEARGHRLLRLADWDDAMGHAQAVRIDPRGFMEGGADPRGDGAASGF